MRTTNGKLVTGDGRASSPRNSDLAVTIHYHKQPLLVWIGLRARPEYTPLLSKIVTIYLLL